MDYAKAYIRLGKALSSIFGPQYSLFASLTMAADIYGARDKPEVRADGRGEAGGEGIFWQYIFCGGQ